MTKSLLVPENLRDVHLIVDEAHYCKNQDTERAQKVRALARQVRTIWALTGTPLPNTPMDSWGLLETCNLHRKAFGSFKHFLELFKAHKKAAGFGPEYEFDTKDLDDAKDALAKVMMRVRLRDIYKDMPAKNYEDVPTKIGDSEVINAAEREWQVLGATTLPPFSMLSKAMTELANLKIPGMLQVVKEHEDDGVPLLVFSDHREPILELERRAGWGTITGANGSAAERNEVVRKFQAGELKGVGLTIKAGGVGLTLDRADTVLFVDRAYNATDNQQAEDRCASIQDGKRQRILTILRLIADHPLDRRLVEITSAKIELAERVVG